MLVRALRRLHVEEREIRCMLSTGCMIRHLLGFLESDLVCWEQVKRRGRALGRPVRALDADAGDLVVKFYRRGAMRDGQLPHSCCVALLVQPRFSVSVQRGSAFIQHSEKSLPVAVLLLPFIIPIEAGELLPLLLPQSQRHPSS